MKAEVEQQMLALLGPKTEADVAAAAAPKKKVRVSQAFADRNLRGHEIQELKS